jgi:hypothetical protein
MGSRGGGMFADWQGSAPPYSCPSCRVRFSHLRDQNADMEVDLPLLRRLSAVNGSVNGRLRAVCRDISESAVEALLHVVACVCVEIQSRLLWW